MVSGPPITLEEVTRIRSTSGSLYEVIEECVVVSMDDNMQAEFLYPGSIVLMLEYYPRLTSFGFYDHDADAKVLTKTGFIGNVFFSAIKPVRQTSK